MPDTDDLGSQLYYGILVIVIALLAFLFFIYLPVYITRIIYIMIGVLIIAAGLFFHQHQRQEKLDSEHAKLMAQLGPSYRLIDTTDCIFRILCDHLQVLYLMLPEGKEEVLSRYIFNMATEMRQLKYTGVKNPVIASVILSHKILAREKGIDLLINMNTILNDYTARLDLLEQVLDRSLKLLVENEIISRSKSKLLLLDISEVKESYIIFLSISEEAAQIFQSWELLGPGRPPAILDFRPSDQERFAPVLRLLERLDAPYTSKTYGNFTGELTLWLQK